MNFDIKGGFINLKSSDDEVQQTGSTEHEVSVNGKLFELIEFHSKSIELSLNLCSSFFTFIENDYSGLWFRSHRGVCAFIDFALLWSFEPEYGKC